MALPESLSVAASVNDPKEKAPGEIRGLFLVVAAWVVVKIMVPFWVPKREYGTYYLGYPKRGPNFDNYPLRL